MRSTSPGDYTGASEVLGDVDVFDVFVFFFFLFSFFFSSLFTSRFRLRCDWPILFMPISFFLFSFLDHENMTCFIYNIKTLSI